MGANFYVDTMLPAVDDEAYKEPAGPRSRQVEIFTHGSSVFLRIGKLNEEHQGAGYCVELTAETAAVLIDGLEGAARYLGASST